MRHLLSLTLQHDQDVVTVRQRAVHISQLLGFDISEQTRIATAVSEIVRNAFRYATRGSVDFMVDDSSAAQRLVVRVTDQGPGIARLDDVLSGRYRSSTGMGLGIVGARRLMDGFTIESSPAGTTVVLEKALSPRTQVLTAQLAREIADAVLQKQPDGLIEEIQQQNQQLLRALDELQRKQQELVHINRELEDTNRGVVALYAELDEKADHLRRADELKSRFLSNMTHEFRTPVNSIIGLSNLLLEDYQRDSREPLPEVVYIRQAAEQLSELVNDLLDLAKVEAGKVVVRPSRFDVSHLFGALRGMLRPLLLNQSVSLVFEDSEKPSSLYTDEGKLSQILRNLISNALKFTERGEVRVTAVDEGDDRIRFVVADTGIGIAEEHLSLIFEEFTQLEHRLQRGVRGTGLGLPLSRRLSELLGGTLEVASEVGVGSTFTVRIPMRYATKREAPAIEWQQTEGRLPILIVDDAVDAQYLYEKILSSTIFQGVPVKSASEAEAAIERFVPAIVILDVVLAEGESWGLLEWLKRDSRTSAVPIIVVSSAPEREKALTLGADAFVSKPVDRRLLLNTLTNLQARAVRPLRVLSIDDEHIARFMVRQCLPMPSFDVIEAATGADGLARARDHRPDVVLLDLVMPDADGAEVLKQLRADPATRDIPVIIVTSQVLDDEERMCLLQDAQGFLSKAELSRDTLGHTVRAAISDRNSERRERATPAHPL